MATSGTIELAGDPAVLTVAGDVSATTGRIIKIRAQIIGLPGHPAGPDATTNPHTGPPPATSG